MTRSTDRLERRLTDRVRERWIGALVRRAPEHAEEAAALMAAHRHAEDEVTRFLTWDRALGLATRPYRRNTA